MTSDGCLFHDLRLPVSDRYLTSELWLMRTMRPADLGCFARAAGEGEGVHDRGIRVREGLAGGARPRGAPVRVHGEGSRWTAGVRLMQQVFALPRGLGVAREVLARFQVVQGYYQEMLASSA